jgi:alpha-tubulin suppressor-like RCC1 family protein
MVDQVTLGENFISILDTENSLFSWGGNDSGELGIGDFDPQTDACSIDTLIGREIVAISAGRNHIICIGAGGQPEF